jgi:hypothetical protein
MSYCCKRRGGRLGDYSSGLRFRLGCAQIKFRLHRSEVSVLQRRNCSCNTFLSWGTLSLSRHSGARGSGKDLPLLNRIYALFPSRLTTHIKNHCAFTVMRRGLYNRLRATPIVMKMASVLRVTLNHNPPVLRLVDHSQPFELFYRENLSVPGGGAYTGRPYHLLSLHTSSSLQSPFTKHRFRFVCVLFLTHA